MSDNESKAKLIECAKKEFLEKGFAKASLRKITADAGLTTGAVYFFFRDKNGLFGAVVEEAIEGLKKLLTEHYADDMEEDFSEYVHVTGDHDELAKKLVDLIYDNYDVMMILFDKAHGSEYENVIDSVIALLESENLKTAEKYAKAFPGKRVNKYMLHYLSHVQVDAFEHLLNHESNRERALEHIKPVMDMFITTFMNYILEDDEV